MQDDVEEMEFKPGNTRPSAILILVVILSDMQMRPITVNEYITNFINVKEVINMMQVLGYFHG
jgi:hypothetical protein